MTKEKVMQMAFEIISSAGEAMDQYYNAVVAYKKNNIKEAEACLKEGDNYLKITHRIQTELIQSEVNEEEIPYSLIMTHAQDHLSSAINWQRMVTLLLEK